jgi:hypothetical protein
MPRADTQFKKGHSGRPKGTKNKRADDILAVCQAVLMPTPQARIAYLTNLRARILKGEANHMELFLTQHLWGKPAVAVDKAVTYRFEFVGFDRGDPDELPAPLPGSQRPAAALGSAAPEAGEAGPDVLAPPLGQGDDLAAVDDPRHEPEGEDLLLPLPGAPAGAQNFVGRYGCPWPPLGATIAPRRMPTEP